MTKVKIILNYIEKEYGKYIDDSPMRKSKIFELLIGTVLSQRTRDENTEKAAKQLFAVAKTPKQILKLPMKKLQSLIRVSGPYKQKAKRIFSILFSIYVIGTIGGIFICLLEAAGRIRFYNYARLPLWEGKLILASNHPSWLDVVILPMLYFPWWFRELLVRIKGLSIWPFKIIKTRFNS